jgi:hypothetical protein
MPATDASRMVVATGGADHGGACLRRVMFITRPRMLCAMPFRHCPARPGRTMFPFVRRPQCRHGLAGAAIFKGTSLHADELRGGGEIEFSIASGVEPSLDGDKRRRGGTVATNLATRIDYNAAGSMRSPIPVFVVWPSNNARLQHLPHALVRHRVPPHASTHASTHVPL